MRRNYLVLWAVLAFAVVQAQAKADGILGSADNFAVLGGETVTNTGPTTITGNLGVYPGSAITGFPPGSVSGGVIHGADAVSLQAKNDVTRAYVGLAAMPYDINLSGADLGGLVLTSGVYHYSSEAQLTGTLTLDAEFTDNAYWVFQIGTALTTASGSVVDVINLGSNQGYDIGLFWQVGTSTAILGTNSAFQGNILALTSINLTTGATILNGRALARNGEVTLDNNVISIVCPNGGPGYNGGLMYDTNGTTVIPVIPEPGTLVLLFSGLVCLLKKRRISVA